MIRLRVQVKGRCRRAGDQAVRASLRGDDDVLDILETRPFRSVPLHYARHLDNTLHAFLPHGARPPDLYRSRGNVHRIDGRIQAFIRVAVGVGHVRSRILLRLVVEAGVPVVAAVRPRRVDISRKCAFRHHRGSLRVPRSSAAQKRYLASHRPLRRIYERVRGIGAQHGLDGLEPDVVVRRDLKREHAGLRGRDASVVARCGDVRRRLVVAHCGRVVRGRDYREAGIAGVARDDERGSVGRPGYLVPVLLERPEGVERIRRHPVDVGAPRSGLASLRRGRVRRGDSEHGAVLWTPVRLAVVPVEVRGRLVARHVHVALCDLRLEPVYVVAAARRTQFVAHVGGNHGDVRAARLYDDRRDEVVLRAAVEVG